ncbi:MAG TPA: hypothetical protein VF816_16950 [Rhodocyclaceae bacterium]
MLSDDYYSDVPLGVECAWPVMTVAEGGSLPSAAADAADGLRIPQAIVIPAGVMG